jgi:hypothetical protein
MVGTAAYNVVGFISHQAYPVTIAYNHKHPPVHQEHLYQESRFLPIEEKGVKEAVIDQEESDSNIVNIHLSSSIEFDGSYLEKLNIENVMSDNLADKNQ